MAVLCSIDFMPSITLDTDDEIQLVEEMKILGVVLSLKMKRDANTANMNTK